MTTLPAMMNPLAPVTPPPENQTFLKPSIPLFSPQLKRKAVDPPLPSPPDYDPPQSAATQGPPAPPQAGAHIPMDPRAMAMVSRIANYYQQRSQAIANFQHQRCQAWANMHREKCQEMGQAAMLVVAWYVRDRIQRRRRRQKSKFRNGLRERRVLPKVTRGEAVRRWVLQVPETLLPPSTAPSGRMADKEEVVFSMDNAVTPDKDAKLFEVADSLIRSQHKQLEVPLLGVLNFDDSDSDSDGGSSDEGGMNEDDEGAGGHEPEIDYNEDEFAEDDEDLYDEDLYDEDDEDASTDDDEVEGMESELAHHGTGTGSKGNTGPSLS